MKIVDVDISELRHDPRNARVHNERNLDAIRASLKRYGQQYPIVVDIHNQVVAGNGRLEAARSLGWLRIKCVITNLDTEDARQFAIADNRSAELAEWDLDILRETLESFDAPIIDDLSFDVVKSDASPDHKKQPESSSDRTERSEPRENPEVEVCPECGQEVKR